MASESYRNPAPAVRRVRAYFAPVNRSTQTPQSFDPVSEGGFDLDAPPAPWVDLGWIRNFTRRAGSRNLAVSTGTPAAPLVQVRESLNAEVSFEFLRWTKLTMALATASQHMNLLAETTSASAAAEGGSAIAAVSVLSGSTANAIVLSATDAAKFSAGSMIAVDADYAGSTGFVGSPVAGGYLRNAITDVDYVRRVTFNVGLVASVTGSTLALADALPGGAPATNLKVQSIAGFVDREGGCFYQEWSGVFVAEGSQGERVIFYYPRLQSLGSAEEVWSQFGARQQGGLEQMLLKGKFLAMPVTDALDGEKVLCYRSYLPASKSQIF